MAERLPKQYEIPTYLFHQGTNARAYEFLGAHPCNDGSVAFRVWAPHAQQVSVVGDFNAWDGAAHPMRRLTDGGIWECFEALFAYIGENRGFYSFYFNQVYMCI